MSSAKERLVKELDRCGWVYTIKEVLLWVSLTTVKDTDPRFAGLSKLDQDFDYLTKHRPGDTKQKLIELGIEYKVTHTNFKGKIYWVQVPGSLLVTTKPEKGITVEFRGDGSFLRGTHWGSGSLFAPSRLSRGSGDSLKEIMGKVALHSPEKLALRKAREIESAQKELDDFLLKKAEYEAKVSQARVKIAEILSSEDTGNMDGWIDALLSCGYLGYTFHPEYRGTLEEYQFRLEKAKGTITGLTQSWKPF